ncbi:hypothetical protein D3C72_2336410 [compost metagenome]
MVPPTFFFTISWIGPILPENADSSSGVKAVKVTVVIAASAFSSAFCARSRW